MDARLMSSTVMLTVVGAAVLLAAPPAKNIPATVTFGDGAVTTDMAVSGVIGSGTFGAFVTTTNHPLNVNLASLIPYSEVYLRECEVPGILAGCNPTGPLGASLAVTEFDIKIKPILADSPDADDRPGGLTGMACGSTSFTTVHYTFWLGGEGHWGLNANPRYHAGAASVTRADRTTWAVTATGVSELVSFNHSGIKRKSGPSHEGRYTLPFQLTIEALTAPTAPGCV